MAHVLGDHRNQRQSRLDVSVDSENFGMSCAQLLGASVRSTYLTKPREKLEIDTQKNAPPFEKEVKKIEHVENDDKYSY